MSRKDIIFEIDRQLIENKEITITKEVGCEIIRILKDYDKLYEKIDNKNEFKNTILNEIKYKLEIITETKINHLILADKSDYHHHRFIAEKEKCDLLEELIDFIYNTI